MKPTVRIPFRRGLPLVAVAALLAGCTGKYWRGSADREASRLIREKTPSVPNMDTNFTVEPRPPLSLESLSQAADPGEFLGSEAAEEAGSRILPLETALDLAVRQSRDYQTRKELLYLQALDLSLSRQRLRPIFGSRADAAIQNTTPVVVTGQDPITGETVTALRNGTRLATGRGQFGFSWLLATGARLSTDFTADFLRFIAGNGTPNTSSRLGGTLTQPLLRGAGFKANLEGLTQAERNLLYALREFAQYRQNFAVDTSSAYYQVLQLRDTARNSFLDLRRSRQNVERERAFAEEGQRPLASLDQFRQAELNSETRWIDSVRAYRESLDRFKISLGIPVVTRLVLDDRELAQLRIEEAGVPLDEAVPIALGLRLDLQTSKEQVEDAARKVPVAKNSLLPQVDAVASGGFSANRTDGFALPDPRLNQWNAGLTVDLGLDRKAQRNDYRRTLIASEQSKRQYALAVDNVRLQVASNWRALEQARRNFENAELGVTLAARRVEEQELRMQLGRGQTRDLLEAQSDLNAARNARTAAVVGHTLARLRYWRDMGLLFIRDDGTWYEAPVPHGSASPVPEIPKP